MNLKNPKTKKGEIISGLVFHEYGFFPVGIAKISIINPGVLKMHPLQVTVFKLRTGKVRVNKAAAIEIGTVKRGLYTGNTGKITTQRVGVGKVTIFYSRAGKNHPL